MGPQDFCAKTCHEISLITKQPDEGTMPVPLMGPQSIMFPSKGLGRPQQGLLLYSCAAAALAVRYSQPLVEPHFTRQRHRHPVDESFGLFRHIRLGAGHLQLNDTPSHVLRERRRAKLSDSRD